jgi:hypothetical protein
MSIRTALRAGAVAAVLLAASAASAQSGPPSPPPADDELAGDASSASDGARARPPRRGRERTRPRAEIHPYVEANAGMSADLSGGDDDVLTYTSVAAGVDGRIETQRVVAQASYRYERRIDIEGDSGDQDVHTGVALVHAQAAPGLSLDAGALAARSGGPGRGSTVSDRDSSAQVFSAYAGPTLNTRVGPLQVGAAYRLGYARVDGDGLSGDDDFDESVLHNATASVGMGPGRLPFGWTVGGGYAREESGDLENRLTAMYVRGDVVVPLGPTFALTAGVGYENIESSQQDVLRDANGVPVVVNGRLVADPSRPRLRGYETSGVIYDAGFIWRPDPRTEIQGRAGHRYGGTTVIGSLRHQFPRGTGVAVNVYDSVGTAGSAIINNVTNLPTDFDANRNPLTGAFDGCVFGRDPGTGTCFDQALQSLSSGTFRGRGANILFSGRRGPWNWGVGAGYDNRRYTALVSGDVSSFDPRTDESLVVNAGVSRRLSRWSGMSIDASASWYDSDRIGFDPVFSTGVTGSYYRSFMIPGLQFHSAVGIYHSDGTLLDSTVISALIGLRYTF